MKIHPLLLLLLTACMVLACQDDEMPETPSIDPPQSSQNMHTVEMMGNSFSPRGLTISEGDTVVWTNKGNMIHTSTSGTNCDPDGTWDSGSLSPGESFSYVFSTEGTFDYLCIPHCEVGMTGSIKVEE